MIEGQKQRGLVEELWADVRYWATRRPPSSPWYRVSMIGIDFVLIKFNLWFFLSWGMCGLMLIGLCAAMPDLPDNASVSMWTSYAMFGVIFAFADILLFSIWVALLLGWTFVSTVLIFSGFGIALLFRKGTVYTKRTQLFPEPFL